MSDAESPTESFAEKIDTQKRALDEAHTRVMEKLNALSAQDPDASPAPPAPENTERVARLEEDNEALRADLQRARERITVLEADLATADVERNQLIRERAAEAEAVPQPAPESESPEEVVKPAVDLDVSAHDQHGHKRRMGDILVDAGVIAGVQLEAALSEKSSRPHQRLGEILVGMGLTNEHVIATILAAQLRLPFVDLTDMEIEAKTTARLSVNLARRHRAIVIQADAAKITVAMANPLDLIAIEDIELATRSRVEPVVATPSAVRAATKRAYQIP